MHNRLRELVQSFGAGSAGLDKAHREHAWQAPAAARSTASAAHRTAARAAPGGRTGGLAGEALTCALDEEIHHLDSVKINHHSSAAKGRKSEKDVCWRPGSLPAQAGDTQAPTLGMQQTPNAPLLAPGSNYTFLQKLDCEKWAQAWKIQRSPCGRQHVSHLRGAHQLGRCVTDLSPVGNPAHDNSESSRLEKTLKIIESNR